MIIISSDIFGLLALLKCNGFTYVLSIQDSFSRFTSFIALKNKASNTIANALVQHWISIFGIPSNIRFDDEKGFITGAVSKLFKRFNIQNEPTGINSSHQNGGVERVHRFLKDHLLIYKINHNNSLHNWEKFISRVALKYNGSINAAISETPYF